MRELAEAIQTTLTAPTALRTYQPGEVPNLPTTPYVVIYVERRGTQSFQDRNRVSDQTALVPWRITTLHVGKTAHEAQWMSDKVTERLTDVRVTIDDAETTPIHHESSEPVEADLGVENLFVGASYWTCVSTALQPT